MGISKNLQSLLLQGVHPLSNLLFNYTDYKSKNYFNKARNYKNDFRVVIYKKTKNKLSKLNLNITAKVSIQALITLNF